VTNADIDEAIRLFLLDSQARLTRKYMGAIETMGAPGDTESKSSGPWPKAQATT
jgi:hypothetical protein